MTLESLKKYDFSNNIGEIFVIAEETKKYINGEVENSYELNINKEHDLIKTDEIMDYT